MFSPKTEESTEELPLHSRLARLFFNKPKNSFATSDGVRYFVNDRGEIRRLNAGKKLTKKQRNKLKRDARKVAA